MSYDHSTITISLEGNSFLQDFGLLMLYQLRDYYREDEEKGLGATSKFSDWLIIEEWLDCAGRELNDRDKVKIVSAFNGYFTRGVSPSSELDQAFRAFASNPNQAEGEVPPERVIGVFDRLLATPDQISTKAEHFAPAAQPNAVSATTYSKPVAEKVDATVEKVPSSAAPNSIRVEIFIAAIWVILAMPLSYGIYDELSSNDTVNRIFYWLLVSSAGWLPLAWKKVFRIENYTPVFKVTTLATLCAVFVAMLTDRNLNDYLFVPLGGAVTLILLFLSDSLQKSNSRKGKSLKEKLLSAAVTAMHGVAVIVSLGVIAFLVYLGIRHFS